MGFSSGQVGVRLSQYGTHYEKILEVADCIMARDYKGFGKQTTTGVIKFE